MGAIHFVIDSFTCCIVATMKYHEMVNYFHNDHYYRKNSRIEEKKNKLISFLKSIHICIKYRMEPFQKCPVYVHAFLRCASFATSIDPLAVLATLG